MGAAEVTAFLNHVARERNVAASTQNQALSALLFLYREVLQAPLPWLDELEQRAAAGAAADGADARGGAPAAAAHARDKMAHGELALRGGAAAARVPEAAGEGRRLRLSPARSARRQGRQGPRHHAAGAAHRAAPAPDRARARGARARSRRGLRRGRV